MKKFGLVFIFFILAIQEMKSQSEVDSVNNQFLKVYLDGFYNYLEYIRTEIPYINYVRDRFEADIHLLVSRQVTGSGGIDYALFFYGQNRFQGRNDTIHFSAKSSATEDEIRIGLVKMIQLGCASYIAKISQDFPITISYTGSNDTQIEKEVDDKWNGWVYSVGVYGNASLSSSFKNYSGSGEISAKKVTDKWKTGIGGGGYLNNSVFDFGDGTTFTSKNDGSYGNIASVKSLNDHWSTGLALDYFSSTYSNYNMNISLSPAIEYNIFPYDESTTKLLAFFYTIGPEYSIYTDSTIFDKTEELLFKQNLDVTLSLNQKWGYIDLGLEGSTYLHDFKKNSVGLFTSFNWSITEGLTLNGYINFEIIRDQLNLPKEGASEEEILLQIQELQTDFEFFTYFGLNYTFGSIYNNIVNPRFRAGNFNF